MMSLESRLSAIVALLPPGDKPRFTASHGPDESTDTRLVDAVRALAKAEGLVCMTPMEFSRAVMQQAAERSAPPTKPADENPPLSLAARFNAITDPRAQTAFWRSLTAAQQAALLNSK